MDLNDKRCRLPPGEKSQGIFAQGPQLLPLQASIKQGGTSPFRGVLLRLVPQYKPRQE